jgi:hypothetical protein
MKPIRDRVGSPLSTAPINQTALAEAILLRLSDERLPLPGRMRLMRDIEPMVAHRLSPFMWGKLFDDTMLALAAKDHVTLHHQHFRATAKGHRWRDERLGWRVPANTSWPDLRDQHLLAHALKIGRGANAKAALASGEGLRRLLLERTLGVKLRPHEGLAGIRDVLARHALRTGTVTGDLAVSGHFLTAPERRAQAATLIKGRAKPDSDHRLIARIAAEQVGSHRTSPAALRMQLLRAYMCGEPVANAVKPKQPVAKGPVSKGTVPRKTQPAFELGEFLAEVRNFARECAQGWSGNRRALVSRVFPRLAAAHPDWGLDVGRFKTLLAEAHKAGRLNLVHADLRDKKLLDDLAASAIAYHNMTMHFIRVEDETSDAA